MKRAIGISIFLHSLLLITACSPNQINFQDVWARPAGAGENSAVYFTLENNTALDDILLSATCESAAHTEIHMAKIEDGVMKMEPVDTINVPPGEKIDFAPGGLHVMLIDLDHPLEEGEQIMCTLEFSEAGFIEIKALIEQH